MLISVVIPAYNAGRFIRETLNSVIQQTHRNLEIIVVDDGSTDNTVAVIEELQGTDDRIVLYQQANQGASVARNLGIDKSNANFIAFLDADDLWHPTKIEKQHNLFLKSKEDVGLVYAFSRMIDVDSYIQGHTGACILKRGEVFHHLLINNFVGNGSTAMVRRAALPQPKAFDPEQKGNEDSFFYLRIAAKHKVDVVPEFLIGYRWNTGQNNSSNINRQINSRKAMMKKVCHLFPGIPQRVLSWSDASFYLSYAQTKFKKREYKQAINFFFRNVLTVPTFIFSPPVRRLMTLIFKAAYRKSLGIKYQRRKYFDADPKTS